MRVTVHEGGCLCGHVRYRATGAPLGVNYCHCGMCRRQTGAPVAVFVTFARDRIAFVGGEPARYRSSALAQRGFCPRCGSALTWEGDAAPTEIDVTVGSLDRPENVAPRDHLWTETALPWLRIADDLPRYRRGRRDG